MHTHGIQRRALLKAGAAAGLASLVPSCGRQSEPSVPVPVPQTEISAPSSGGALRVDLLHSFDGSTETLTATSLRVRTRLERAHKGPRRRARLG